MDGIGTRIAICGASGSGKSTLARELGEALGLTLICPDVMRLRPHWTFASAAELRDSVMSAIGHSPGGWVIDDLGGENSDLIFEQADTFIWLRLPMRTSNWRLIRRSIASAIRPVMVGAGNRTGPGTLIFATILLVRTTRGWQESRRRIRAQLRERRPGTRLVVLRTPREVDAFLAGVRSQQRHATLHE